MRKGLGLFVIWQSGLNEMMAEDAVDKPEDCTGFKTSFHSTEVSMSKTQKRGVLTSLCFQKGEKQ